MDKHIHSDQESEWIPICFYFYNDGKIKSKDKCEADDSTSVFQG